MKRLGILAISSLFLSACGGGTVDRPTPEPEPEQPVVEEEVVEEVEGLVDRVVATSIDDYRIDTGDKIYIQVFDEPDLTMDTTVGTSGVINYSYLGSIQVKGKTPAELSGLITTRLKDGYLVNPSVNVSVTEYRPFFIYGQVTRPGSYPYQPGLTLDKAVSIAGGLTDRASRKKMYLTEQNKDRQSRVRISMQTRIAPGDTIMIEEGFF